MATNLLGVWIYTDIGDIGCITGVNTHRYLIKNNVLYIQDSSLDKGNMFFVYKVGSQISCFSRLGRGMYDGIIKEIKDNKTIYVQFKDGEEFKDSIEKSWLENKLFHFAPSEEMNISDSKAFVEVLRFQITTLTCNSSYPKTFYYLQEECGRMTDDHFVYPSFDNLSWKIVMDRDLAECLTNKKQSFIYKDKNKGYRRQSISRAYVPDEEIKGIWKCTKITFPDEKEEIGEEEDYKDYEIFSWKLSSKSLLDDLCFGTEPFSSYLIHYTDPVNLYKALGFSVTMFDNKVVRMFIDCEDECNGNVNSLVSSILVFYLSQPYFMGPRYKYNWLPIYHMRKILSHKIRMWINVNVSMLNTWFSRWKPFLQTRKDNMNFYNEFMQFKDLPGISPRLLNRPYFAWHGTRAANVSSILKNGFSLEKTLHGRLQGDGVYLATNRKTAESYSGNEFLVFNNEEKSKVTKVEHSHVILVAFFPGQVEKYDKNKKLHDRTTTTFLPVNSEANDFHLCCKRLDWLFPIAVYSIKKV